MLFQFHCFGIHTNFYFFFILNTISFISVYFQFFHFSFQFLNKLSCCFSYCAHERPQFPHLQIFTPPRNIRKRIVRSIQSKILTHRIGNAFRLYLLCSLIFFFSCLFQYFPVMQLCMGNFVNECFYRLTFTHIFFHNNLFPFIAVIPLCLFSCFTKADGNRGYFFDRL